MKADRSTLLQHLVNITAYEACGRVDLPAVPKHKLLPVSVSLAETSVNWLISKLKTVCPEATKGASLKVFVEHHHLLR